jgi:hypothetical protein
MSVKVDLHQLAGALTDFTFAYLVTVDDGYRAHTVAVEPALDDGVLDVGAVGATTRNNVGAHPDVTVVWPPREPGGYTLIVDGTARLTGSALTLVPTRAVLHRPAAPGAAMKAGCLHDCVPLEGDPR